MRVLFIVLALTLGGCSGFAVDRHSSPDFDGVSYKTVEVYKHNAFGPSFSYVKLFVCDAEGKGCVETQQNPNVMPGFVASLIAPVIQAGGMVAAGYLVGAGMRDSGDAITLNNQSTSMSNAAAKAASHSSAAAVSGSKAVGIGVIK